MFGHPESATSNVVWELNIYKGYAYIMSAVVYRWLLLTDPVKGTERLYNQAPWKALAISKNHLTCPMENNSLSS